MQDARRLSAPSAPSTWPILSSNEVLQHFFTAIRREIGWVLPEGLLGCGDNGCVYAVLTGRAGSVVKVTADPHEVVGAATLQRLARKDRRVRRAIPPIHRVWWLPALGWKPRRPLGLIWRQGVRPLDPEELPQALRAQLAALDWPDYAGGSTTRAVLAADPRTAPLLHGVRRAVSLGASPDDISEGNLGWYAGRLVLFDLRVAAPAFPAAPRRIPFLGC